jgi:ABC-type multidrug transport system fused ATPase/permease subunit
MFSELVVSALLWMTFSTIVAQAVSILLMWWLGLPPSRLVHEIEVVQNPAVGASFFIISLTASLFISLMSSAGFTPDPSFLEGAAWIVGGLAVGALYTAISFFIAHRVMGRQPGETVYTYLRREIIDEQNASLAFFLGGLSVAPFISIMFQLV